MGTVLMKDEELARYLEYGKKQMLLTVVTSIFTWLRHLSNWCTNILTCQLTVSETQSNKHMNVDDVWKDFATAKPFPLLWQLRTVSYSVGCAANIFLSADYIMLTSLWWSGATVRHLGLRSVGRGFKSCSRQRCITTLGKLFTPMSLCHQAA